jgi:hypothetical protein
VKNVHERRVPFAIGEVARLVDSLSSAEDRLWPRDAWPPMILDRGLVVGSKGGHGMIRYSVDAYEPGRSVTFRFADGLGIVGTHSFTATDDGAGGTVLRHEIHGQTEGSMRLLWPFVIRWMHDTVVEDALDTAEASLRSEPTPVRRPSRYVSFLKRSVVPARPDRVGQRAGLAAAGALAAVGAIHLAWGAGVTFPAADAAALARAVVGGNTFPSTVDCIVVATLLASATAIVVARAKPRSALGKLLPPIMTSVGSNAVAGVLATRGVAGVAMSVVGLPHTTPMFRLLDLVLYSPLCLALALAIRRIDRPLSGRRQAIPQHSDQVIERSARA